MRDDAGIYQGQGMLGNAPRPRLERNANLGKLMEMLSTSVEQLDAALDQLSDAMEPVLRSPDHNTKGTGVPSEVGLSAISSMVEGNIQRLLSMQQRVRDLTGRLDV
jgi:hypothetical protein